MSFFIDHVVTTVFDINKSVHFYSNILGMELQEFLSSTDNRKRKSLKFGRQKINLHEVLNRLNLMQTNHSQVQWIFALYVK